MKKDLSQQFNNLLNQNNGRVSAEFLADVVHKIKNGLGGIGGFAALLERDIDSKDPRRRLVNRIQDGVVKVNELAVELVFLSREIQPHFQSVSASALVRDLWNSRWPEGQEPVPLIVDEQLDKNHVLCRWDPRLIEMLIQEGFKFISVLKGDVFQGALFIEEGKLIFKYRIKDHDAESGFVDQVAHLIRNMEPVEARLAAVLMNKIIRLHEGNLSFVAGTKEPCELIFSLNQGS